MRSLLPLLLAGLVLSPLAAPAQETPPRATDARDCPVPPEAEPGWWSAPERYAWRQVCAGEVADMRFATTADGTRGEDDGAGCRAFTPDEEDPTQLAEPDAWPATRDLSPRFLRQIAARAPFAEAPAMPAVRIRCARVTGPLSFRDEDVPQTLWLDNSRLAAGLGLGDARFGNDLSLSGSHLPDPLYATGLSVSGEWFLQDAFAQRIQALGAKIGGQVSADGSTFTGPFIADGMEVGDSLFLTNMPSVAEVGLLGAKIDGNVEAIGSTLTGPFIADGMEVGGSLFLQDMPSVAEVRLFGAKIGQSVEADGATILGPFIADGMEVGDSLFLQDMPSVAEVRLFGAKIGGQVSADGSTFTGPFIADGMEVGDSLFLTNMPSVAEVGLLGAKIGGEVSASGSTFTGRFAADGVEVGGGLFLRDMPSVAAVRLLGAKIGANVEADGSTFTGPVIADGMEVGGLLFLRNLEGARDLGLPGIRVGHDVQFPGSAVAGAVDLTGAEIGGALELWQNTVEVEWQEGAALILRNASAGALQARMPESWQVAGTGEAIPYDLQGFAYDRLGGNTSGADHDLARSNDAGALVDWLQAERPPGTADVTAYGPQPYRQLTGVLRAQGAEAQADRVDFARLMHRRATRFGGAVTRWDTMVAAFRWGVDTLALVFVGFGVYPGVALGWFAALVAAGWAVARRSPELAGHGAGKAFFYSLENALPLIDLTGDFADIRHAGAPRIAAFFHAQKVLGFVLATVLVGALTLLGG